MIRPLEPTLWIVIGGGVPCTSHNFLWDIEEINPLCFIVRSIHGDGDVICITFRDIVEVSSEYYVLARVCDKVDGWRLAVWTQIDVYASPLTTVPSV